MAPSAMRALKQALEKGFFDRAYLFHGDDDFLKEQKVRALIERATDPATRDFNLDIRRGGELESHDLAQIVDSPPMLAERRVLIIRDAAGLKKDARGALAAYLHRPSPDVVVVLVATAGSKVDDSLASLVSSVEFKSLGENDLLAWATDYCATQGVRISPDAIALLCRATGNDLGLIAGEIAKLTNYVSGEEITVRAVGDIVGVQHGETTGDLLDAIAMRDGPGAARLIERTLGQPKASAVVTLMAITTQTIAIGWALAARARGIPQHTIEREFYGLLKENPSSMVGRPWSEAIDVWVRAIPRWTPAAVDDALARLLATELALKDSRLSSDEELLRTLVLAIGVRRPRERAA